MKLLHLHLALLSLLLCLPAQAQDTEYGTGLICNTQQQAEQLVAQFHGDMGEAVTAVNAKEHDPKACGIATVAFLRGPKLATARSKDATFQIVQILIVGVSTPTGFRSVVPPRPLSRSSKSRNMRCSVGSAAY